MSYWLTLFIVFAVPISLNLGVLGLTCYLTYQLAKKNRPARGNLSVSCSRVFDPFP